MPASTTRLAYKCLRCGLHFNTYTWHPERHLPETTHCPECGQRSGQFVVWEQQDVGQVYEHVPGAAARLVACNLAPTHLVEARGDQLPEPGLQELVNLARTHGDLEGSATEVGDLQELLEAFWGHLTPAARRKVFQSEVVDNLQRVAGTSQPDEG